MTTLEFIKGNKKVNDVTLAIENTQKGDIYLGNTSQNIGKMIIANHFLRNNKTIIYIASSIYDVTKAYDTFLDLLGKENVSFFPGEEFVSSEIVASSNMFRLARMHAISKMLKNIPQVIVTNYDGAIKNVMSKEKLRKAIIKIQEQDIYNKDKLVNDLIIRGYKKLPVTETQGTFSVRGEVVDIFPVNEDDPIRINFFDDEIETIKYFNVETQMSIKKITEIEIFPIYEIYYDDPKPIIEKINKDYPDTEKTKNTINYLSNYENLDQIYIYLPYIDENYQNVLDLVQEKIYVIDEYRDIKNKENQELLEITEYLTKTNQKIKEDFFIKFDELIKNTQSIYLNNHLSNIVDHKFSYFQDLKTTNNFDYNNNIKNLIQDVTLNQDKIYIITQPNNTKLQIIKDSLENNQIKYKEIKDIWKIKTNGVYLATIENAYGYVDYEYNFEIITPNEYLSGKINKTGKFQSYYKNSVKIYNKEELEVGDYVVHQNYGIGKYLGIETVKLHNVKNDYLVLEYSDNSKLKIPVENIYILEKYVGSKDRIPKLNKINSKEWSKKKAKVQEKVAELAKKLIKVQAERSTKKGYIYPKDSEEQIQFEKDFGYNETKDQLSAIKELKEELESGKLIDRLLCGDVGFGKTEVAMRGAFKVVEGGKQVAYLAPTTVLTKQHYTTFKERFSQYGIKVELLNRFVPETHQKEIIQGIKSGYVDIVIGTHRLLSKEIKFKDLGLLIIDEEQRFGVEHKERFKELKTDVDVLSLSATPIPRTLQMSLVGVKDLSILETPPHNRLPVQTYMLESNDSVIREAINRELGRKGQVFYLLNRIGELDSIIKKVKKLVPNARLGIIHGRLQKDEIEQIMNEFVDFEIDVLICTTIIETGIDIPNANTLIVERADLLGLSQLYQVRGRVGRSDKIAYAYFMYDKDKILTDSAQKRLEAIKEFTSLGSGYKIAMRDLSIRGAGDILGRDQSGFIDDIGISLYIKMLNDEVSRLKGKDITNDNNSKYKVEVSHHIDALYVGDDSLRIEMHKTINKVKSRQQQKLLIEEFTDRYGTVTEEIERYIEAKYLEYLLVLKDIDYFKETDSNVELSFSEEKSQKINAKDLFELVTNIQPKFKLKYQNRKIYFNIRRTDFKTSYIYDLTKILEKIV